MSPNSDRADLPEEGVSLVSKISSAFPLFVVRKYSPQLLKTLA
jgi:hypothetical protein